MAQVAQLRLGVLFHVVDARDGGRQLLRGDLEWTIVGAKVRVIMIKSAYPSNTNAYPEPAVLKGVNDAVDGEGLPAGPGGLHHRARAQVEHLKVVDGD